MIGFKKKVQKNKMNSLLLEGVFEAVLSLKPSKNFRG
jgi:hypothetical protein